MQQDSLKAFSCSCAVPRFPCGVGKGVTRMEKAVQHREKSWEADRPSSTLCHLVSLKLSQAFKKVWKKYVIYTQRMLVCVCMLIYS